METNLESSRPPVKNYDQHEKSAFRFLTICVVLAAMIFGLIHAVIYFTEPTDAAARGGAKSGTARTAERPIAQPPSSIPH